MRSYRNVLMSMRNTTNVPNLSSTKTKSSINCSLSSTFSNYSSEPYIKYPSLANSTKPKTPSCGRELWKWLPSKPNKSTLLSKISSSWFFKILTNISALRSWKKSWKIFLLRISHSLIRKWKCYCWENSFSPSERVSVLNCSELMMPPRNWKIQWGE